jgi:hypothetical protein
MRATRGILAAAIVAALAMAVATAGASAIASPGATSSAKKCRKAHSKRKRCKRKRKVDAPRSPVIRATLSWGNGAADVDADLFVFDSNGNVAGNGSDTIPLTSLSGDVSGPAGSETFTDSLFTPQAARDLSFGVCYYGQVRTDFTITYVTADGAIHGDSQSPSRSTQFDYPGGAPLPSNYCQIL